MAWKLCATGCLDAFLTIGMIGVLTPASNQTQVPKESSSLRTAWKKNTGSRACLETLYSFIDRRRSAVQTSNGILGSFQWRFLEMLAKSARIGSVSAEWKPWVVSSRWYLI